MNLRDWMSNDESLMNEIPENDRASPGSMKILGLTWIMEADMICLKGQSHELSGLTTRMVLKQLASVYDPLCLFSPVTLQGKIFLQVMWNKKIPWDEPLPEQDELKWMKIDKNLREISDCYIPRYIGLEQHTDKPKLQLLVFCDASQYAYAAAVYLRQEADNICTNRLIFSKARLAPNKELSIPRQELLSALIGVRCMNFVEEELKLEIEQKHVWLDSQCVLKWIGSSRTYTRFVQNRLNEIRSTLPLHSFFRKSC